MSNLKELTWEHHKNAERQDFVKVLMSGKISPELYATYLYNQHPCYDIIEAMGMTWGLIADEDIRRAPHILEDWKELWPHINERPPKLLKVTSDYLDHVKTIMDDPDKLMAHIYVRHMGDLSGGQMISKRVPGEGRYYKFKKPIDELKEQIRSKLNDNMADEAKICFDYATRLFQELHELKDL